MSDVDGFGRPNVEIPFPVGVERSFRQAVRAMMLAAAVGLLPAAGVAQEMAPQVAAAACAACHGVDGVSTGAIPSLDKLDAVTMSAKLKGFRTGEIESTVMSRLTKAFTDAEIDSLVKYMAAK